MEATFLDCGADGPQLERNPLGSAHPQPHAVTFMRILARVANSHNAHTVHVATEGTVHPLAIAPKPSGQGSSINGGELLFLALATCYCNDLYREAAARHITVHAVEVEVSGEFGRRGEPATGISYRASVRADASEAETLALMAETDRVAEIQNTLRRGCPIQFLGAA